MRRHPTRRRNIPNGRGPRRLTGLWHDLAGGLGGRLDRLGRLDRRDRPGVGCGDGVVGGVGQLNWGRIPLIGVFSHAGRDHLVDLRGHIRG
jgi:hypothetical protein